MGAGQLGSDELVRRHVERQPLGRGRMVGRLVVWSGVEQRQVVEQLVVGQLVVRELVVRQFVVRQFVVRELVVQQFLVGEFLVVQGG
jgi:hypothetical protein